MADARFCGSLHRVLTQGSDCGRVIDAPREGFLHTMDISVWSFIRMACLGEPLMPNRGALCTMALKSGVRYIASEVGPKGIRVHAISLGPLATRAGDIPEFHELLNKAQEKAPTRCLVNGFQWTQ